MENRSLEEQLFEQLMRTQHKVRLNGRRGEPGMRQGEPPFGPGRETHGMRGMPENHPPFPPMRHGESEHGRKPFPDGPEACPPFPPPPPRPLHRERLLEVLLSGGEEGMRQKEIGEQMHLSPSSLSEIIDKLEEKDYVERRCDPQDKRATRISLTQKGKVRALELSDARKELLAPLFAELTDAEKETLLALLKKLNGEAE